MKKFYRLLTLIFLIIISSGCDNVGNIQTSSGKVYLENGQVFKGEIHLKANNMNQNGIVRVHLNEGDGVDKIRRGVVYQYSKPLKKLKLYEEVFFKIAMIGNLQIAEINNELSSEYEESKISMKNSLGINLHQGHVEQGSHNKQHVIKKLREANELTQIIIQEATRDGLPNPAGTKDTVHVYSSHYATIDTTKAYYKTTIGTQNNNVLYNLSLDHPPH